jgi:hypothetical protein
VGAVGSSGDEVGGAMVRQYMLPGNHGSSVHSTLGRRETQLLATLHMVDVRFRVDGLEFRCLLKPWNSLHSLLHHFSEHIKRAPGHRWVQ